MHILPRLLAALLASIGIGAQAVEFRSADVHNSDDYPTVAAVKHMSELLDKRSNGKYKIKVFNKGALGSEKETIDQVKIGALDMTRVNISAAELASAPRRWCRPCPSCSARSSTCARRSTARWARRS